ncbi:MAG: hypothetical protein IKA44_05015 [Clostridia bacterium]|nr:hypothetical protein [Clostridia bacterium]
MKLLGKVTLIVLCVLLAVVLLVLGGLNLLKFAIYADYYAVKTDVCKNPGVSDGFICQGICADEGSGKIFVSGYMKDGSASRIYVTDTEDRSYFVSLSYGSGKEYTAHSGGIAVAGEFAYVASGGKLYQVPVASLLAAKNGETVKISKIVPVNNEASFVYADGTYLYVGEFHDGGSYVTNHPYDTPEGQNHAIVSRYAVKDITAYHKTEHPTVNPDKIYSIRNKVQGICFAPDGTVLLSTSYGLADTVYYAYREADAVDSGEKLDGAPVYFFGSCTMEIKGPAMGEDLDFYDGKFLTLTESASDKYIFGKFFFADRIVALELSGNEE